MADEVFQKNVLGEKLEVCSVNPVTGWFRDGCCNTDEIDRGVHTVCARVTTKFLEWAKKNNYQFYIEEPKVKKIKPKSYSSNFDMNRKEPWTH